MRLIVGLVVLLVCACSVTSDFDRFQFECVPTPELCDGDDDDCDGSIDEDFDLSIDPTNCGACSAVCPAGEGENASCREGGCVVACETGRADCNRDAADGCEADLTSTVTCGACETACTTDDPLCSEAGCVSVCPGTSEACLDRECHDLDTELDHCGECERPCQLGCFGGDCEVPVQISTGVLHGCAVFESGNAACWGINSLEQLGRPNFEVAIATQPVAAPDLDYVQIAAGGIHTCARTVDGSVYCWGDGSLGQTGSPARVGGATPIRIEGLSDVVQLAAGAFHTCARQANDEVLCWGDNSALQIGDTAPGPTVLTPTPVSLGTGEAIVELDVGQRHNCVRTTSGQVVCWGDNRSAQVTGPPSAFGNRPPVRLDVVPNAVAVAAGGNHTCVADASVGVICVGSDTFHQLGGSVAATDTPISDSVTWGVLELTARENHTCALGADGVAHCWGDNGRNQLGRGTALPRAVVRLSGFTQVSAGSGYSCGVATDGELLCWGEGRSGQLGIGAIVDDTPGPTPVAPIVADP